MSLSGFLEYHSIKFYVIYQNQGLRPWEFVGIGIRRVLERSFREITLRDNNCLNLNCNRCQDRDFCPYFLYFPPRSSKNTFSYTKPYRIRVLARSKNTCSVELELLKPAMKHKKVFTQAIENMIGKGDYKIFISDVSVIGERRKFVKVHPLPPSKMKFIILSLRTPLALSIRGKYVKIPKFNYVVHNILTKIQFLEAIFDTKFPLSIAERVYLSKILTMLRYTPIRLNVRIGRITWDDLHISPAIIGILKFDVQRFDENVQQLLLKCITLGSVIGLGSMRIAGLGDYTVNVEVIS